MMRRDYWWIITRDPETKQPFLIAGGDTEDEARHKGLETLGGIEFELRALPTRNLARASSMIKGRRLEKTHSLRKASQRLGHDKSVRRMQNRKRRNPPNWPVFQ